MSMERSEKKRRVVEEDERVGEGREGERERERGIKQKNMIVGIFVSVNGIEVTAC